jgi:hypothetical protein
MNKQTVSKCPRPTSVRLNVRQDKFIRAMAEERAWSIAQCIAYCIDFRSACPEQPAVSYNLEKALN